jgi:hypothetical protein
MLGREALRRLREEQAQPKEPERELSLLDQIPVDAPMDDATLTVWNGARWVAWDKWLATAPLVHEEQPQEPKIEDPKGARANEAADLPPQSAGVQEGLW